MHAHRVLVIRRASTRVSLAAFALALACSSAGAATFSGFSIDAGATAARFGGGYGDAAENFRLSPTFGAALNIGLGQALSLRPGIAWISRGGKVDRRVTIMTGPDVTQIDVKQTWVVDCLDVLLLLYWEVPGSSLVRPFVACGPGLSWRVATDLKDGTLFLPGPAAPIRFANIFEDIGRNDFLDYTERFDVNAIIGTGVTLGRGRTRARVEARYLHGMRDVAPEGSFATAYHRAFTVTAGVEIR